MLLHLYGLDYLKKPGKDDTSSTSKKYRKRSEYLNTETRREGEPLPAWRRIDTESPRTRLCTGRQRYRACSNVCNCRLSYHHDLQNAARHKFRVTLTGLLDIRRLVEPFNLAGNQELLYWMRRLTLLNYERALLSCWPAYIVLRPHIVYFGSHPEIVCHQRRSISGEH